MCADLWTAGQQNARFIILIQEHVITVGWIQHNYGPTDVANPGLLSREGPRIGCRVHRPEGCPWLASGAVVLHTLKCVTAATKSHHPLLVWPVLCKSAKEHVELRGVGPRRRVCTAYGSLCSPERQARSKDNKLVLVGGSNLREMLIFLLAYYKS